MPGTYRYSATFDKPYVESSSPPPRSPVRFSIGSWQGSSAPPSRGGGSREEEEEAAHFEPPSIARLPDDDLPPIAKSVSSDDGIAPPLNGSYRNSARTASTDSLESASCGSVSGSSAASSSGGSGGHSRQVSMEGSDFVSSRLISGKMPVASSAASHNPLQFVKVGPVPLYKKAEEQIKIAKEKKISRECIKENEEAWQSNLDSWKNRRRKMSEKSLQRLEEMKQIEEREKNLKTNNAKVKTFSEMMEERAQKPRSYNLSIYVNNSEEDLANLENGSTTENPARTNDNSTSNEEDFIKSQFNVLQQNPNVTESKMNSSSLQRILVGERIERKETYHSEGCSVSADDGFAEEDGNLYGIYTGDSGLESFGSSQRIGDLADSSSELSTDSGSVYDRIGHENDTGSASSLGHITTGTDLLREFSSSDQKSWPSNLEQKENYIQRNLRISISPQNKTKDFGFTIRVDRAGDKPTSATIDTIQAGSLSEQAGLRLGDEIVAVNGELSHGRSHSSLMFSVKQSVYRGHLDLVISRHESNDDLDEIDGQNRSRPRSHVGPSQRRLLNNRSFDDTWQSKNVSENNFRTRSKSESSRSQTSWSNRQKSASLDEKFPKARDSSPDGLEAVCKKPPIAQKPVARKIPPPVPAKPKFNHYQNRVVNETTAKEIFADAIERLNEIASSDITKQREPATEHHVKTVVVDHDVLDSNYAVEKSHILDDMVQSENEDAASQCVTPLLRTLSDGLRDSTSSPQFLLKQDHACFSDFNESEQDTEKEIEPETNVGGDNYCDYREENIRTVSVLEATPPMDVNAAMPVMLETITDHAILQMPRDFEKDSQHSFPLNPLYKDSDGFNIIYQSHEELSAPKTTEAPETRTTSIEQDLQEALPAIESPISVVEDTRALVVSDSETGPDEGPNTDIDDILLADLESAPRLAQPPTEKPPPPPPVERESPERSSDGVVVRNNTFKRVKKEIWKRRSDFLGIDPSTDEVDIDVPPPPDISEILKTERAIERQGRVLLERERSNSLHYRNECVPDLTQKETEIIRNLEQEEKLKKRFVSDQDDQELMTAESGNKTSVRVDDDERIKRLQDERRRMSEERILREEERISMEEERMFREREEQLRLKETGDFVAPVLPETNFENAQNALRPLQPENLNDVTLTASTCSGISASSTAEITMDTAEALQRDRERLREEQEALRREREKYRCQMELEQQGIFARNLAEAELRIDPRHKSLPNQREAAIWISKQSQRYPDDVAEDDLQNVVLRNKSNEQDVKRDSSPPTQSSTKDVLHILGAAPKAKIIQNEQWISYNDKVAKRRSEPAPSKESRYNQNHWLLHEAEMRRISEQNERKRLQQSPEKRYSLQNSLPQQYKSSQSNGLGTLPSSGRDPLSRIPPLTAPRPYERPPPPPKPSHVVPIAVPNEPWNYEQVPAPITISPNSKKTSNRPSLSEDYRNPPVGKYSSHNNRSLVPPPHPIPAETQPQEQFLSVSGKERCSHCGEPLGHGGAMIIESLQLCYHMRCFCCCVCQAQLGNGLCGTDVRVRSNKLHCQNCYSNDEAGLKFSQV